MEQQLTQENSSNTPLDSNFQLGQPLQFTKEQEEVLNSQLNQYYTDMDVSADPEDATYYEGCAEGFMTAFNWLITLGVIEKFNFEDETD